MTGAWLRALERHAKVVTWLAVLGWLAYIAGAIASGRRVPARLAVHAVPDLRRRAACSRPGSLRGGAWRSARAGCRCFAKRKLRQQYPQLEAKDADLVERGFRQFFMACARSDGKYVAMPSQGGRRVLARADPRHQELRRVVRAHARALPAPRAGRAPRQRRRGQRRPAPRLVLRLQRGGDRSAQAVAPAAAVRARRQARHPGRRRLLAARRGRRASAGKSDGGAEITYGEDFARRIVLRRCRRDGRRRRAAATAARRSAAAATERARR